MTRQARLGGRATIACIDIDVPDEVKPLAGHEPGGRRARRGGADDAGRQPHINMPPLGRPACSDSACHSNSPACAWRDTRRSPAQRWVASVTAREKDSVTARKRPAPALLESRCLTTLPLRASAVVGREEGEGERRGEETAFCTSRE